MLFPLLSSPVCASSTSAILSCVMTTSASLIWWYPISLSLRGENAHRSNLISVLPLIPMEALKPRLQLQLPHSTSTHPSISLLFFYRTSLSLIRLSVLAFLRCSTPTPSSWLGYFHYVGIPKCEGRVFLLLLRRMKKPFPQLGQIYSESVWLFLLFQSKSWIFPTPHVWSLMFDLYIDESSVPSGINHLKCK